MNYALSAFVYTLSLSLGMLLLLEVGRRIGLRRWAKGAAGGGSGERRCRFDTRRQLIVEETNAIGTAYVRLDLLPTDAQPTLRERFRQYLAARLAVYRKFPDVAAA